MRMSRNSGKILWGLLFLLGAVYLIASKIWSLPGISVFNVILGVFCVWILIEGIRHVNFWEILFPIAFICILFSPQLGLSAFTPWPVLGAALLGSIGLSMIFKPKKHHEWTDASTHGNSFGSNSEQCDGENLRFDNSFGESIKYINTDNLCSVSVDNSFGATSVYFDNAIIQGESATVHIDNSFGEVSLYVPRAWKVDVNVDKAFGGINMRGRMEGTSTHRLIVTGETNFGALTIVFI